jgi:hypothetical protein
MNAQLQNFFLVSALAVSGIGVSAANVWADTMENPTVPFNGTVMSVCAFGAPSGGILGDTADPADTYITSETGTSAKITLSCNGNASLQIANFKTVTQPNGVNLNKSASSWNLVTAKAQGKTAYYQMNGSGNSILLDEPMDLEVVVDMKVPFSAAVKPGQYKYTTQLTAIPQ